MPSARPSCSGLGRGVREGSDQEIAVGGPLRALRQATVVKAKDGRWCAVDVASMIQTAQALVAPGKGILAADESTPTMEKRLRGIGLESNGPRRREYREILFTAAGIGEFISGVILFDETIRQ